MSIKLPSKSPTANFPRAFRTARVAVDLSQEAFDTVSSRTYVSMLERGVAQPTLSKVDALAGVLGLHHLTLLALSSSSDPSASGIDHVLTQVRNEISSLAMREFSLSQRSRGKL